MTWGGGKPHEVGDRGQRYEVSYERDGNRRVFGWSDTLAGANAMARSIDLHPTMSNPKIKDRQAGS